LESQGEFALVGAGSAATSLAAEFSRKPGALGPVVAVSLRVASRIANSIDAGTPARDASVLRDYSIILVHAPPNQMKSLTVTLSEAGLSWTGKSLIFVECEAGPMRHSPMASASFAWIRRCPMPGRLAVGGDGDALHAAIRLAGTLDRHPIVVPAGVKARFDAAMLLGGPAFTPIIDSVAHILRETGMMDKQAVRTAVALFQSAVQGYSRSGRQSWEWHIHPPDVEALQLQIEALGGEEATILRSLIQLAFARFQRHTNTATKLRDYKGR